MFNQLLAECLEGLGFTRSFSDESIFMRPSSCGTVYEYVATYVDDLCIYAKEPKVLEIIYIAGGPPHWCVYLLSIRLNKLDDACARRPNSVHYHV